MITSAVILLSVIPMESASALAGNGYDGITIHGNSGSASTKATATCPDVSNVTEWKGRLSFSYSASGTSTDPAGEYANNEAANTSFQFPSVGDSNSGIFGGGMTGGFYGDFFLNGTGSVNDRFQQTSPTPILETLQGSGSLLPNISYIRLAFNPSGTTEVPCTYSFDMWALINTTREDGTTVPRGGYVIGIDFPITGMILKGDEKFPVEVSQTEISYLPSDFLWGNSDYATVSWEFEPVIKQKVINT